MVLAPKPGARPAKPAPAKEAAPKAEEGAKTPLAEAIEKAGGARAKTEEEGTQDA